MPSVLTAALLVLSASIGAQAQLAKESEKAPAPMASGVDPVRHGDSALDIVVEDAAGAVIMKASVSVIQEETSAEFHGQSNERGGYAASDLAPGTYALTAEARGFKVTKTRLRLRDHEALKWAIELQVGATTYSDWPPVLDLTLPTRTAFLDSELLPEPAPPGPVLQPRQWALRPQPGPVRRFFSALGHKLGF